MNLLHVRKGQFVYYHNKLHKVYGVKPFFKQSVHLIRLENFEQQLATAKEIELYKPKHLDSFVCNHSRFTLHKEMKAKIGDYILVINPRPDSLDRHHLHAIETVSSLEENGVITNKSNGIKHNEYWVMAPGLLDGATVIDLQHRDPVYEAGIQELIQQQQSDNTDLLIPKIGDIFQKNKPGTNIQTMVIAINDQTISLGGNIEISTEELTDPEKWQFICHISDQ